MSTLDINKLLESLDNDNNEFLLELNNSKIKALKNDILQRLQIPKEKLREFHKALQEYRYVNDISELTFGKCIRSIFKKTLNIQDLNEVVLNKPVIFCEIKITDHNIVLLKSLYNKRIFHIKMNENVIFQNLRSRKGIVICYGPH